MANVIILSGAVLIKQSESQSGINFFYHKKCDKCGHVDHATINSFVSINSSPTRIPFRCSKCGSNCETAFKG